VRKDLNRFRRLRGERRYRKLFVLATEGSKTEPQYFALVESLLSGIHVKCLSTGRGSAPPRVLARMKEYLRRETLRHGDEAWLVVDKDQWSDDQLGVLHEWTRGNAKHSQQRGLALSNPCFEVWLLLHFEDAAGVTSSDDCVSRLRKCIPGYDKDVCSRWFSLDKIRDAVRRARHGDHPPCEDWPRIPGHTTVYRLVERMLDCIT